MILTIDWSDYNSQEERHIKVAETIDLLKKSLGDTGSFSVLMFFRNRKPLRIRSNRTETMGMGDKTLEAIDDWCECGKNSMIIKTSTRHHMNDIFPSKTVKEFTDYGGDLYEEIFFHYYTGKYGNQLLWSAVNQARNSGTIVGDSIRDYFKNRDLEFITRDIAFHDEDADEYTDRNFEYSIYDRQGECILQVGRNEEEGEYEHLTPRGCNFIGGYDDIQ